MFDLIYTQERTETTFLYHLFPSQFSVMVLAPDTLYAVCPDQPITDNKLASLSVSIRFPLSSVCLRFLERKICFTGSSESN